MFTLIFYLSWMIQKKYTFKKKTLIFYLSWMIQKKYTFKKKNNIAICTN